MQFYFYVKNVKKKHLNLLVKLSFFVNGRKMYYKCIITINTIYSAINFEITFWCLHYFRRDIRFEIDFVDLVGELN